MDFSVLKDVLHFIGTDVRDQTTLKSWVRLLIPYLLEVVFAKQLKLPSINADRSEVYDHCLPLGKVYDVQAWGDVNV